MSAPTGTRGSIWTRGNHWGHHGATPPHRGIHWE